MCNHVAWSFFTSGAKCERAGGRAGDCGGHGRPGALHPRQRIGPDERPRAAQLEQPDLHPFPERPKAQLWIPNAALPR